MIEISVKDVSNKDLRSIPLKEEIFGMAVRPDLLHAAVNYQMAKRRGGTAKTKGRSEVNGGGRKPFRQKGTGNARQGTIRAPHYRGGGIVFGPQPRDFSIKLPKKVRRLALMSALSAVREDGGLIVVDALPMVEIKTQAMLAILSQLEASRSALIVLAESDRNVELSARNLPNISVIRSEGVNVYDLLSHDKVIFTEPALKMLEERLA